MQIIVPLPRPKRRRMHKAIQSTFDKGFARCLIALLALHEGKGIVEVHEIIGAARFSIGRWINWYTECGIDGLKSLPAGRPSHLPMNEMLTMLTVFILLVQPVYSPWVNVIERLLNAIHETVTRNHKCQYMWALLQRIKRFMDNVSPFPGGGHGSKINCCLSICFFSIVAHRVRRSFIDRGLDL